MQGKFALICLGLCPATVLAASIHGTSVKVLVDEYGTSRVVSEMQITVSESLPLTTREYPQFIVEHQPVGLAKIIELRTTDSSALNTWLRDHHVAPMDAQFADDANVNEEVRTIVSSGPSSNRIDLVFMGDGYTDAEREKFFTDINRLVNQMFVGRTFASYLPLFNVHAVFKPSHVSGIGHGSAIDTAYGLYREGETLRAIFPSNTAAIRASCNKAPGCDYPLVIANDPYYGGLGGEVAISTSSNRSGMIVLRHELGHNFGLVGEEYDGGGYFGANYSSSISNLSWQHWATDAHVRAEPMMARYIDWPWQKLDRGPFTASFDSDGKYAKTWIRVSASGIETDDTMSITLDGKAMSFSSPNRTDRSFINIEAPGLTNGNHKMVFSENVHDHNNWFSNIAIHEYAAEFHEDPAYVGAFPVFSQDLGVEGYRPTNESCLMRDMEHEFFCSVCQENNWLNFFAKVKLIDSAAATHTGDQVSVQLGTLQLGKFRIGGTAPQGESLQIHWFSNGQELTELRDLAEWTKASRDVGSSVEVRVTFISPEIRKQTITDSRTIQL